MLQGLQVIQILWVGRGWSEDELSLDGSEKWQDQSKSQETPGLETSILHAHLLTHPNAVEISWARAFWQTERAEFKSVYVPVKNAIWLFKGTKAIAYQRIRKALEFKSLVHQPFGKDISPHHSSLHLLIWQLHVILHLHIQTVHQLKHSTEVLPEVPLLALPLRSPGSFHIYPSCSQKMPFPYRIANTSKVMKSII